MINALENVFNKIILHLRLTKKKYRISNQFCKKCGREMHYDYNVSDEEWNKLQGKYNILCWDCFCDEYPTDIHNIDVKFYGGKKFLKDSDNE